MNLIFLFLFQITNISIEENILYFDTSINLEKNIVPEGTYNLYGEIIKGNKKIGTIYRLARIYFPCKIKECNYPFKIEVDLEKIKKIDLIDFLKKNNFKLNIKLKEINSKKEKIIETPFDYFFSENISENINLNLIVIENINVNLKEKPSIEFDLKIKNPFNFKVFLKEAEIIFRIENKTLQNNFKINEEIEKGEKVFNLKIPIEGDLLFLILSKKFMEEDISTKISSNYNGNLIILIEEKTLKIPF